jgi:hypothetical protein
MHNKLIIALLFIYFSCNLFSQIAPGEWRDHLPYKQAKKTVLAGDKVYACTSNSLFYYDKTDNSINTISKVQGLTEALIATIDYSEAYKTLIVVYDNLNIDFLVNNTIINFPYVKNKTGIPNKKINNITVNKNLIFLSCSFGVVVIDIDKKIVVETYYPGSGGKIEPIIDLCFDSSYIYAATEFKIFRANKNDPFLIDNNRWELLKSFNSQSTIANIKSYQEKLYVLMNSPVWGKDSVIYFNGSSWLKSPIPAVQLVSMTVANNKLIATGERIFQLDTNNNLIISQLFWDGMFATCDAENNLWLADNFNSILRIKPNSAIDTISPESPTYAQCTRVEVLDNQFWSVTGGLSKLWAKLFNHKGFSGYFNNMWHSFNSKFETDLDTINDFVNVKINPYNTSQVFLATWGSGLLEYNNGKFTQYNSDNQNSTIQRNIEWAGGGFMVYGMAFDNDQNLWITNSWAKKPLSVKTRNGKWYSFSLPFVNTNYYRAGEIIVTSWGHKWILSPKTSRIIIFDDNNTPDNNSDDASTTLDVSSLVSSENALVDSKEIFCIAEDRDGTIWVGTDAGPIEISGGQNVFQESGTSSRKIKVPLNIGENFAAFLLETEQINSIAVDGGNRKWLGTQNSGAYLVSADGTKQIAHFTAENSPLLSNTINDISIEHKSGEIFFATENGLISFRGNATQGNSEFGDVYVFPNPVRENFDGDIIVTNLLTDAIVKITDVSGNLVFETKALGGQAVWNGKNLLGNRVNTGVYLVFCSNDDGTKTFVTKLLFIH